MLEICTVVAAQLVDHMTAITDCPAFDVIRDACDITGVSVPPTCICRDLSSVSMGWDQEWSRDGKGNCIGLVGDEITLWQIWGV